MAPALSLPSPGFTAAAASALSARLSAAVEREGLPAVTVAVANADRVLYEGAFGAPDVTGGDPLPLDGIFDIGSMTKPITSIATMMLVEEGRLRLDDEVWRHLPRFAEPQVITECDVQAGTYRTRPGRRPITVRHLLTHTSGIGYAFCNPILWRLQQGTAKAELDLPLLHEPGERWLYGAGPRVLGQLIEAVSGRSLADFLSDRVFAPLGMIDTAFSLPPEKHARAVRLYMKADGRLTERPNAANQPASIAGDFGLCSTARDYIRFLQMVLNGGRHGSAALLDPSSIRAMSTNQIGPLTVERQPTMNATLAKPFPPTDGRDTFGFGFQIAGAGSTQPYARRAGSLSWFGLYNTHFWVDPDCGLAVVVLMQIRPLFDDVCASVLRDVETTVYRSFSEHPPC